MTTLEIPVTPEEEEAWRRIPVYVPALVIEAGCTARIRSSKDGTKGHNTGRLVRVLMPIKPGESYGHLNNRLSSRLDPTVRYWSLAAMDGKPLTGVTTLGVKFKTKVLALREGLLERVDGT